ncbi:hypothetical protein J6590_012864 [Homalodisca vitripennis]|nr:hypothetical protein J6590_012864 [Homalodisca vitripennis]
MSYNQIPHRLKQITVYEGIVNRMKALIHKHCSRYDELQQLVHCSTTIQEGVFLFSDDHAEGSPSHGSSTVESASHLIGSAVGCLTSLIWSPITEVAPRELSYAEAVASQCLLRKSRFGEHHCFESAGDAVLVSGSSVDTVGCLREEATPDRDLFFIESK